MAGRHRKPPAWRQFLRSLVRSRDNVRVAALQAEIAALRATVARLEAQLAEAQLAEARGRRGLALEVPLVTLALSGTEVDRGPEAVTEIALPEPVVAETKPVLPERELLDPRADREPNVVEVVEQVAEAPVPAAARAVAAAVERRIA